MRSCIISSNCQGVPLASQLASFPEFDKEFTIEIFLNYTHAIIPHSKLEQCDLLIYQQLDNSWGELSEKSLLQNVNPKAKTICMPNMMNFALWPTACNSGGGADDLWGDRYIDFLISKKLDVQEIVFLAKKANLAKLYQIDKVIEDTFQKEREKTYFACKEICDFVEENYKAKQLFSTPNHPYGDLLTFIAKIILKEIGYNSFPDCFLPQLDCDPEFHLPIHPNVLEYLDVSYIYIYSQKKYPVFGRMLTYEEYLYDYVLAKQQGILVGTFLKEMGKIVKNN